MSESVNIVEAKIVLQQMREDLKNFVIYDNYHPTKGHGFAPDPKEREKRWVLSMQIAAYDMAIRKHEGTYKEPWL